MENTATKITSNEEETFKMKNIQRKININEMARVIHEEEKKESGRTKFIWSVLKGVGGYAAFAVGLQAKEVWLRKKWPSAIFGTNIERRSNIHGAAIGLGFFALILLSLNSLRQLLVDQGMEKEEAKDKAEKAMVKKLRSELSKCKNTSNPEKCQAKIKKAIAKLKG